MLFLCEGARRYLIKYNTHMAELNLTSVSDEEWKKFIAEIAAVQDKHGLLLIPTFKWNAVQGISYEWGAMRKPDEVPKTSTKRDKGDSVPQEKGTD